MKNRLDGLPQTWRLQSLREEDFPKTRSIVETLHFAELEDIDEDVALDVVG